MGSEGGEGADFIADDNHPPAARNGTETCLPFFSKVTVCQPSFWSKKASKQPPFDCMVLVSDTVLCYSSYCCGGEENASFCTSAFRSRRKSAIISHMRTTSKRFHDFSGKLVTCKSPQNGIRFSCYSQFLVYVQPLSLVSVCHRCHLPRGHRGRGGRAHGGHGHLRGRVSAPGGGGGGGLRRGCSGGRGGRGAHGTVN